MALGGWSPLGDDRLSAQVLDTRRRDRQRAAMEAESELDREEVARVEAERYGGPDEIAAPVRRSLLARIVARIRHR